MVLILVLKVVVALSVLMWYGTAVLRFVNDHFQTQFRKQLEEEYSRFPEMRNSMLEAHHDQEQDDDDGNFADGNENFYNDKLRTSKAGVHDPQIIIIERESNGKMSGKKKRLNDDHPPYNFLPVPPPSSSVSSPFSDMDDHYDSVPESSQSGGQRRAQEPQFRFFPNHGTPETTATQEGRAGGEWSLRKVEELTKLKGETTTGEFEEYNGVDDISYCGCSGGDCTLLKNTITGSANLLEEHGPIGDSHPWNNDDEYYCATTSTPFPSVPSGVLKSKQDCSHNGKELLYQSFESDYYYKYYYENADFHHNQDEQREMWEKVSEQERHEWITSAFFSQNEMEDENVFAYVTNEARDEVLSTSLKTSARAATTTGFATITLVFIFNLALI